MRTIFTFLSFLLMQKTSKHCSLVVPSVLVCAPSPRMKQSALVTTMCVPCHSISASLCVCPASQHTSVPLCAENSSVFDVYPLMTFPIFQHLQPVYLSQKAVLRMSIVAHERKQHITNHWRADLRSF